MLPSPFSPSPPRPPAAVNPSGNPVVLPLKPPQNPTSPRHFRCTTWPSHHPPSPGGAGSPVASLPPLLVSSVWIHTAATGSRYDTSLCTKPSVTLISRRVRALHSLASRGPYDLSSHHSPRPLSSPLFPPHWIPSCSLVKTRYHPRPFALAAP